MKKFILLASFFSILYAHEAKVLDVKATCKNDICSFDVTVLHEDSGWDHYVDKWDILDENKNIIATRILYHPHEHEQPFTRGLDQVKIPANSSVFYIRAHDKVHGYGKLFKFTR